MFYIETVQENLVELNNGLFLFQPLEYYIYAILLAVATFIFIVMAKFYKYQHNGPYQNGDLPQGDDDDELRDDGEDSGLDHEDNANETKAKINKGRFCWRRGGRVVAVAVAVFL